MTDVTIQFEDAHPKYRNRVEQKNATQHSARSAKRKRVYVDQRFIGVDGEGINVLLPDGSKRHDYVMLSVGDETLFCGGRALTHHDIFPFLYRCFEADPDATYVGFFLSYDFAMWLKSLSEHEGRMLFTKEGQASRRSKNSNPIPFPVYAGGWEFDMLGMKRFKLRPRRNVGEKGLPWMFVNDTGAFHQAAFLSVIAPEKWPNAKPCTDEEYATIREGKEGRADEWAEGDVSYFDDMARYNRLENLVLGRLMSILNAGFTDAGVQLKRDQWYGPGQAIQNWLDQRVKFDDVFLAHRNMEQVIPAHVLDAWQSSYYGGWFEQFAHGHIPGPSYEYDITSAYPHAMRSLPCLCDKGAWTEGRGRPKNVDQYDAVLVYGEFKASRSKLGSRTLARHFVGPLPHRTEDEAITHPEVTEGWYSYAEVMAAQRATLLELKDCTFERWIAHSPCGCPPPLAGIADLFNLRLAVGKTTPQGKALKLMFNSAYGKFAQSIGSPKYGNPVYASLITSGCRVQVLDAIGSHGDTSALLMVATDAVYFRTPHAGLDSVLSDLLGGWERGEKSNLTLMKPGVYWDDKARESGHVAIKSRGISARSLAEMIPDLDAQFDVFAETGSPDQLPSIEIAVPFSVVSPRLALARGKWETCGMVEWDQVRTDVCTLYPKRQTLFRWGDIIRSSMRETGGITKPYSKRFGFGETELTNNDVWGLTPEGTVASEFTQSARECQ